MSTPSHVKANRIRIVNALVKLVAEKRDEKFVQVTRGNGMLNCNVILDFPNGQSVGIPILLQWPLTAARIASKADLTKDRLQDAAQALLVGLRQARNAFHDLITPFWERVSQVLASLPDEKTTVFFNATLIKSLRVHVRDNSVTTPHRAVEMIMNGLEEAIPRIRVLIEEETSKEGFRAASGVDNYAGLFPVARGMGRKLIFNAGPTNAAKSYTAFKALMSAESGCFLAPLRLMALEGADRINAAGVPCDLRTGEETILADGARHVSSTIEMMNTQTQVKVAIIDEVQMLLDRSRGWAWTKAVVGVPADVVYMTGSADAIPMVRRLAEMCGEDLTIVPFERLSPLEALKHPVRYNGLQDGDAIVAFSRNSIFTIRETVQSLGLSCAVLYGSLGPEVRRAEAERFRDGSAKVLIATDAIGMGLNLRIKRVLLAETFKYDGISKRSLNGSEIRQICGRAGRYDPANPTVGYAGVLAGNDSKIVLRHLDKTPKPPEDTRVYASPHWELVRDAASLHRSDDLTFLMQWCADLFVGRDLMRTDLTETLTVSQALGSVIPLQERFEYLGSPVEVRLAANLTMLREWAMLHGQGKTVPVPNGFDGVIPSDKEGLAKLEQAAKIVSLWLWLNMRYPEVYVGRETALEMRASLSEAIETCLREKVFNRLCEGCRVPLPAGHRFPICDPCFTNGPADD